MEASDVFVLCIPDLTPACDPELVTSFFSFPQLVTLARISTRCLLTEFPETFSIRQRATHIQISDDFFEGPWSLMPGGPDVQHMPDPSSMGVSLSLSFLVSGPTTMKCSDKHCALTCCSQPTLKLQMGKNHMAKTHRGIT